MTEQQKSYCRFCAEPKTPEKLVDIVENKAKCDEISTKLRFLNAFYVDVCNSSNMLPKTICFVCYDSLNDAYTFLTKVKTAQDYLYDVLEVKKVGANELSDDDRMSVMDDLVDSDAGGDRVKDVKSETVLPKENSLNSESRNCTISVEIKQELKEEFSDPTLLLDTCLSGVDTADASECTLNMQDIINSAINPENFQENLDVYVKELPTRQIKGWKDYPWICAYCNMEFQDVITLRLHSRVVHRKCSPFWCADCEDSVRADKLKGDFFNFYIDHVKEHRKSLRLRCHYCDKEFKEKTNLTSHMKHHFNKSQVACPACGQIFKNEPCLQKHLKEYKNVKERKPRRKRGTPVTVEDLTCKYCNKVYKNLNSKRDHMRLHTANRAKNFTCDRCGKTFYNKGTLTSHIMAHDKILPHNCKICQKSFMFPNMLRKHVMMHTNVKPFSCEQCGKCFRLPYQLNSHKIVHTDEMPYVCSVCNKAFRFKQILKNHERQHTGAKPYFCQQCGMEFTNWSNYNKHAKRRHGTDLSKKKITPQGVFPINPETGQIVQVDPVETEEWRSKIMTPGKRGKKKMVKDKVD